MRCVRQEPQLGTGHAVQQAAPLLDDEGTTLILNGDVPLISADTARQLIAACDGRRLALLTLELDDPSGYGRIVREGTAVRGIVEHKDASACQRAIREVYTGIMAAPTAALKRWLARLTNHNAQHEYYLTDVVAMAVADGVPVATHAARDETEVLGVNSAPQLADLERRVQRRQADALMAAGVRLADPARLDVRGELSCGSDVEIDVNCVFEGRVVIGDGARIGAHCVLRDTTVGAGAEVMPFCHFTDAVDRRAGAGRPVRAAAPRRAARPRSAHRQLRRGEELHAGARRQGQPPGLPGRQHGGRARQLRRRQHHRQLRRRQQAPHRDRQRRARGLQLRAGGAGDGGRRRHHRRRQRRQQGGARQGS